MPDKHKVEQMLLDDYKKMFDLCINICYLIEQSGVKEKMQDVYDLSMKKASGNKMLMDYLNKNDILPRK